MASFITRGQGLGLLLWAVGLDATAQSAADIETQQSILQKQRERAAESQQTASGPDVRLPRKVVPTTEYPRSESPCFPIQQIKLEGDGADKFQWVLAAAGNVAGRCLGTEGINVVLTRVQNALVGAGFVTTRVVAAPQDLRTGAVTLVLVPGRIKTIRFATQLEGSSRSAPAVFNTLPTAPGDLLQLRDIEQGLENFKRVPSAEADIQIVPGEQPGESDLLLAWRQARAWRFNLSVDDGGSRSTGRYQGNATLSIDNPLGLNDLFYASISNDLGGNGHTGPRGTRGHALHYSLPFGYSLMAFSANDTDYRQSVAGASQNYVYSGSSRNLDVKLGRMVYREAARKIGLSLRGYQRDSHNYIDDTEVLVQRRRMGGFELGANLKQFIGSATVTGNVAMKRGTGAFGTLAAPEQAFGEGTARPRLLNADASLSLPFAMAGARFDYQGSWRAQWNRTALIAQDRFAIGGRYTVRGFDGESSLSAERGWLLRNDFIWRPAGSGFQPYLGVDYAEVAGPSSARLAGKHLAGAVLGVRGQLSLVQFDVFAGAPISKPDRLQTAAVAAGFNLSIQY
jgi:hemolysin activation/secretion protein